MVIWWDEKVDRVPADQIEIREPEADYKTFRKARSRNFIRFLLQDKLPESFLLSKRQLGGHHIRNHEYRYGTDHFLPAHAKL